MKFRFLSTLFGLLLAFPALANACTCSSALPGQCPGLQPADTVFLGTVTDVQVLPPEPAAADQPPSPASAAPDSAAAAPAASAVPPVPITRYRFHIDEPFAGPSDPEIDIFSGGDDGDCGYKFQKGAQYIVYTQPETAGRLFATLCNGTRPAADGTALLPQLRAMREGRRVASVFGVLRRADPPFLSPPDDPDDPIEGVSLKLRSNLDRFQTNSGPGGVYSFYDVHGGTYDFTANLAPGTELTQKTLNGPLPPFHIPEGACYEYNVDALPIGHVHGSVVGQDGKPLAIASVELFRAGSYSDDRPGYWGFQGAKGVFDFDHVGPGQYILVYNRPNRHDPNSPFARTFYPGVPDAAQAKTITLKDGQDLEKIRLKVVDGYPSRSVRVRLQWTGARPAGTSTVSAKADQWENPSARKIADGLYEFTLFDDANYTISAWEDLIPQHFAPAGRRAKSPCVLPARLTAPDVTIAGADSATKEVTLVFPKPSCAQQ